jgi:small conductance mechanosensitive channel
MEILGEPLVTLAIRLALILALAAGGLFLVKFFHTRVVRYITSAERIPADRRQLVHTLASVARWALNVLIVGAAVLMVLAVLGVNMGPALASLGIVGLALSLGAQTLVKDTVGGLLILAENQFAVGDSILVGPVSGDVERITLRATYLRTGNGELAIVPNGEVRIVTNQTRGWARAVVDLGVAYEADLEQAQAMLRQAAADFAADPALAPDLLEPPEVLGVQALTDWAVQVRVQVKTLPGRQWPVARALRRHLIAACDRAGLQRPYSRQELWLRQ